jgi:GH24 family phage-related lysozyme (muramidase)
MNISQKGIDMIKEFEGCKLTAYDDGTGTPTIGYGHTKDVKWGDVITQEKAEELLKDEDLPEYEGYVQALINNGIIEFPLNQNMFDALTSFCMNLGNSNLIMLVKNRNASTVADKILLYNHANGEVWEGLTRRRNAERQLFLKPCENVSRETITKSEFSQEYDETGIATICVDKLNIRDYPSTSKGNIVGAYYKGEQFLYSHVVINDGFVWCRYKAYSGNIRYVAVKEISSSKRYANCV